MDTGGGGTIFAKIGSGKIYTKNDKYAEPIRDAAEIFETHDKDGTAYERIGINKLFGTIKGFSLEDGYKGMPNFNVHIQSEELRFKISSTQKDFIMQNLINIAYEICENNCELEFSTYEKTDKDGTDRTRMAVRKRGQTDTLKGRVKFEDFPKPGTVIVDGQKRADFTERIEFFKKLIDKINTALEFEPGEKYVPKPLADVDFEGEESPEVPF